MNPYLVRVMDLEEKISRHYQKKRAGMNPYASEFVKTAGEIRRWDEERKTAVKESNNDSISEISIKIDDDDDLVMLLCPRVKLIYNRNSGPILDPLKLACTLRRLFIRPDYSNKPVFIDLDDVRSNDLCQTISVFVRDFSFIPPPDYSLPIYSKIALATQFLRHQNLANLSVLYDYFPRPLVYELLDDDHHPDTLLHQFQLSYPGYMEHRRPVIVVEGLVSAFPSSTSNKSTHLLNFFSFFGKIRFFDIQLDTVLIEYQLHSDFLDALNTLCCCSIRKNGCHKLFEFEVELKCPVGEEKEKQLGILELVEAVRL